MDCTAGGQRRAVRHNLGSTPALNLDPRLCQTARRCPPAGQSIAYMNHPAANDNAIREKLGTYTDPYLAQTLAQAKAVASVTLQGEVVKVDLVLGFPCADYVAELKAALQNHLQPLLGQCRLDLTLRAQIMAHAAQRTLKPP